MVVKILVTGADGFVGKTFCRMAREAGYYIRGTMRVGLSLPYCDEMAVTGDFADYRDWPAILEGMDAVVHLAARVHVMQEDSSDGLEFYRRINVQATELLARAASKAGVKRFIFASSVMIQGGSTVTPYSEEGRPNPKTPYAVSKWEAEQMLHRVQTETGLPVTILRPPLMYGPGVKANFLKLLHLIYSALPLPLGGVQGRRSILFIDNFAHAIFHCLENSKSVGQTFLLSDGPAIGLPHLIKLLARHMERPCRLFPFPPSLLHRMLSIIGRREVADRLLGSLEVDDSKIRRLLGWHPPVTLETGLAATVAWYMQHFHRRRA